MPEQYTYLLVDFLCIVFPFVFSFHPKIRFYKQYKYFLVPCLLTATFFLVWDIVFTIYGIWSFNPRFVTGIWLGHLPAEEYLFFICIPYSCVFTYYIISTHLNFKQYPLFIQLFSFAFFLILLAIGFSHIHEYYTSVTFCLLASLILALNLKKASFLARFYISFILLLIPFFLSNGVLTGSFWGRTVVMYNNDYNLKMRLLTIPIEDIFYGMLLVLMNVTGFEYLRNRSQKHANL